MSIIVRPNGLLDVAAFAVTTAPARAGDRSGQRQPRQEQGDDHSRAEGVSSTHTYI
jgi:hypothetical protein